MKISPTLRKRFEANTQRDACGCLIWVGNSRTNGLGYGVMSVATGVSRGAHQVAWFLKHGEWPRRLRHLCDNPLCCEVDHLLEGSQKQNMQDKVERGRQAKGEKHGMSKLSNEQRDELRRLRAEGWSLKQLSAKFGLVISGVSYIINHGKA